MEGRKEARILEGGGGRGATEEGKRGVAVGDSGA